MASVELCSGSPVMAGLLCKNKDVFQFQDATFFKFYSLRQVTLRKDKVFTDVLLKANDRAIPCHKLALASASPFFYKKLTSPGEQDILELQDVDPDILELITDYIYTAKIEITTDNVKNLVTASTNLQLTSLKDACDKYITDRIEPANAIGLLMYAKKHSLKETLEKARQCLSLEPDNIHWLAPDEEFKVLTEDSLTEWISDDELDIIDESVAFLLVQRWVEADCSRKNEDCIQRVLAKVRLALCSSPFLISTIQKHPLFQYKVCQQQVEEAKNYALLKATGESTEDFTEINTRPRNNAFEYHLVVIGGGTNYNTANKHCWSMEYDSKSEGTWCTLHRLPRNQANFSFDIAGCIVDGGVIITGGADNTTKAATSTKYAWLFSIATKSWQQLPSMNHTRCCHAAVSVGHNVIVAGGYVKQDEFLSSVEMLDETRIQWVVKSPMPCGLSFCHAFNINEKVYVLSAYDGINLQYNVKSDAWQKLSDIPSRIGFCPMTCVQDNIYVFASLPDINCYRYDTNLDTWTTFGYKLPALHRWGCAVEVRGKILLCGGEDRLNKTVSTIDVYDPQKDKYNEYTVSLPKKLAYHCAFVMKLPKQTKKVLGK